MSWRIGVDIGGTFTDVAVLDEASGRVGIAKVSTTPRDFGAAVIDGIRAAMDDYRITPDSVSLVSHATTIVTNALLEAKGASVALVTTRGFRDVLELRRSARADLYDLFQNPPAVLVPRRQRFEVNERIDAQGEVVIPLDDAELDALAATVRDLPGVEAVAVCLMFSFLNDAHERRIGERLRTARPGLPIFLSSEILPEIREFERASTTAVCAYVGPVLASYLERLEAALAELELPSLYVMGSNGGVFDVPEALRMPAGAVESGPAAGVIAAQRLGRQIGRSNLISFDMGGTTAKASLLEDGRIETTSEYEVGGEGNVGRWLHGTGHPIRVPVIDLAEVSAGGGSIAWLDPGGALRVGPQSAGAEPGPACYGKGGRLPTVTDANVVLGYLSRTHLLGGRLPIDASAAEEAIREHLAEPLGQDVRTAAAGIVSVVNNAMAEALRIVSVERGHDAREFSLVAFGGAGPVHAAALAEELGIDEVIVPPIPGGFSALGLVASDLRRDYSHTFYTTIGEADVEALNRRLSELEAAANTMLHNAGLPEADRAIERSVDCRYTKQAYELAVPLEGGAVTRRSLETLAREFHSRHLRTYGHENPDEPVQMVNVRVTATGRLPQVEFHAGAAAGAAAAGPGTDSAEATTGAEPDGGGTGAAAEREVWFGGPLRCPVIGRRELGPEPPSGGGSAPAGQGPASPGNGGDGGEVGGEVGRGGGLGRPGPFIVEEMDCTVVVPPDWNASLDERGSIRLAKGRRSERG